MQTVILKVNDQVVDKLMWLLNHFKKDEIDIMDKSYLISKDHLQREYDEMMNGDLLVDEEDFWQSTVDVLNKYE